MRRAFTLFELVILIAIIAIPAAILFLDRATGTTKQNQVANRAGRLGFDSEALFKPSLVGHSNFSNTIFFVSAKKLNNGLDFSGGFGRRAEDARQLSPIYRALFPLSGGSTNSIRLPLAEISFDSVQQTVLENSVWAIILFVGSVVGVRLFANTRKKLGSTAGIVAGGQPSESLIQKHPSVPAAIVAIIAIGGTAICGSTCRANSRQFLLVEPSAQELVASSSSSFSFEASPTRALLKNAELYGSGYQITVTDGLAYIPAGKDPLQLRCRFVGSPPAEGEIWFQNTVKKRYVRTISVSPEDRACTYVVFPLSDILRLCGPNVDKEKILLRGEVVIP